MLPMLLYSCKDKSNKVIVDFDDLRPKPHRTYEVDPDTVSIPTLNPADVSSSFRALFEKIYEEKCFIPVDTEVYPYRFGAIEYLALQQQDVNEKGLGTWYFLTFRDSIMTDNALLNWLDCFGKECQSLSLGSGDNIAENTGQIWVNDTLMVAFISNQGGSLFPKEVQKMEKELMKSKRYGLRWNRNQAGSWSGIKIKVK